MPTHTEREFKLRAKETIEVATIDAALQELGTNCRLSDTLRHTDTYLDDTHGSLVRAGIGLRVRDRQGEQRLTCKARGQIEGGLFVRNEIEADWPHADLPQSARDLPDEVRSAVEPSVQGRKLLPQLSLSVHREIRMLTDGDNDLCELAIDFVIAQANDRSAMFQEIELEVCSNLAANHQLASKLQACLPIEFAMQDKPTYAAALLGLDPPSAPSIEDQALAPIAISIPNHLNTLLLAAQKSLALGSARSDAAQLSAWQQHHNRMISVLQSFTGLWPKDAEARLQTHLQASKLHADAVIDLDAALQHVPYQLESLPTQLQACGNDVWHWLQSMRDLAHDQHREWLSRTEQQAAQQQFEQDITAIDGESQLSQQQLLREAPARLATAISNLRRELDATSTDLPSTQIQPLLRSLQLVHDLARQFAGMPGMSYKKSLKAVARARRHLASVLSHEHASNLLVDWIDSPSVDNQRQLLRAAVLGGLATMNTGSALAARDVARDALERLNQDGIWRRFTTQ